MKLCRDLGNSDAFRPYVSHEAIPGVGSKIDDSFIRDAAVTYWHQCGTARMGLDDMSVVDAQLRVYGIRNLRIADASIMPRITTGNTMAPSVLIGERMAEILHATR